MRKRPLLTIANAATELGLTRPTIAAALEQLTRLGIVAELTGRRHDRVFVYQEYLRILNEGIDAAPVP
jgi:Fic family protein